MLMALLLLGLPVFTAGPPDGKMGQPASGPRDVRDQSIVRIRRTSPPPANKASAASISARDRGSSPPFTTLMIAVAISCSERTMFAAPH